MAVHISTALDIRCSAALPATAAPGERRCQLTMGHDGPHAVMYSRDDCRVVRTWGGRGHEPLHDQVEGFERLPWRSGFPSPAWAEPARELSPT